ncbi:hypothetical protein NKI04_25205 [Mesorhizobium sp. M0814]|uniref:hypothetical protein n=1 Tax=Mesorhizobium sp. M0814 TaxID=2957004 RepID=UPI00333C82E2
MDRFARIDTLINNARIFISRPSNRDTEGDVTAVLGVNIAGHITQLAAAHDRGGR